MFCKLNFWPLEGAAEQIAIMNGTEKADDLVENWILFLLNLSTGIELFHLESQKDL